MILILKIVVGTLIGLLLFALLAKWFFKRWLSRKIGHFGKVAELLDLQALAPVRLHLQPTDGFEPEDDFRAQWQAAYALGFRVLSDLETLEGEPAAVRAAVHREAGIGLCLCQHDTVVHYRLFALAEGQALQVRSSGPGESVQLSSLHWQVQPDLELAEAFAALQSDCANLALRDFDLPLLRRVFERSHAQREDRHLTRAPSLAPLQDRARARGLSPSADELAQALAIERSQWLERLREALLDQYQLASGITAHAWHRIEPQLQVVVPQMQASELRELLVESDSDEAIFAQCQASARNVFELYDAVAKRLPAARQRRCLRELHSPLRARIYAPLDDAAQATATPRTFVLDGQGPDGRDSATAVLAADGAEALAIAGARGLKDARVLSESMPLGELDASVLEPERAVLVARSLRQPLWRSLLAALHSNVWIWGPPLALAAWNLSLGQPYGWGDQLSFLLLALSLLAMLFLIGPMVAYNQYLRARILKRTRLAGVYLRCLTRLNIFGALKPPQLLLERCKLQADSGDLEQALSRWEAASAELDAAEYLSGRMQILDAGGDLDAVIDAHRALLAGFPSDAARVDLALALAKRPAYAEEAAALLNEVDAEAQTELVAAGHAFARGLLAQIGERDDQALVLFASALQRLQVYQASPQLAGLLAEIQGWCAISLRRRGQAQQASELWAAAHPLLSLHPSCAPVLERYAAEA